MSVGGVGSGGNTNPTGGTPDNEEASDGWGEAMVFAKEGVDEATLQEHDTNNDELLTHKEMQDILGDLKVGPEAIDIILEHFYGDTPDATVPLEDLVAILEAADSDDLGNVSDNEINEIDSNSDGDVTTDEMNIFIEDALYLKDGDGNNTTMATADLETYLENIFEKDGGNAVKEALSDVVINFLRNDPSIETESLEYMAEKYTNRMFNAHNKLGPDGGLDIQGIMNTINGNKSNSDTDNDSISTEDLYNQVSYHQLSTTGGSIMSPGKSMDGTTETVTDDDKIAFNGILTDLEEKASNGPEGLSTAEKLMLENFMAEMLSEIDVQDPDEYQRMITDVLGNGVAAVGAKRLHLFQEPFANAMARTYANESEDEKRNHMFDALEEVIYNGENATYFSNQDANGEMARRDDIFVSLGEAFNTNSSDTLNITPENREDLLNNVNSDGLKQRFKDGYEAGRD